MEDQEDVEEEAPKPKRGRGAKRGAKSTRGGATGRGRGRKKKVVEEELEAIEEQNTEDSEATENGSQVLFFHDLLGMNLIDCDIHFIFLEIGRRRPG